VRIGVTCGDPAGIGAEVAWKALHRVEDGACSPILIGPRAVWERAWALLAPAQPMPCLDLEPTRWQGPEDWDWGRPAPGGAEAAVMAVEQAVDLALRERVDAIVTAPLSKEGLQGAGRLFAGHTEMLEHLCGGERRATMMLAGGQLRVVLVTTHLALRDVPAAITRGRVLECIVAADRGLRGDLGIASPRIAVAGLNPHAGEGGVFGVEERTAIGPAVEAARAMGLQAAGPLPADSVFHRAATGEFDAVVAMYHDQGLGPLKLRHFHDGVNVTLGLPIVRTSPDHGTAYDIAGRGVASPGSFLQALRWAARIAERRRATDCRRPAVRDGETA
jgi:4-hydroxythreonine-4-phosphate dehydrogenase